MQISKNIIFLTNIVQHFVFFLAFKFIHKNPDLLIFGLNHAEIVFLLVIPARITWLCNFFLFLIHVSQLRIWVFQFSNLMILHLWGCTSCLLWADHVPKLSIKKIELLTWYILENSLRNSNSNAKETKILFKIGNNFSLTTKHYKSMRSFLVFKFECTGWRCSYIDETCCHAKTRIGNEHISSSKKSSNCKYLLEKVIIVSGVNVSNFR